MVIKMIDGAIEVGSTVVLKPEFDRKWEETRRRLSWLKGKNLLFSQRYKVKEIHLVHLVHGRKYFVIKLDNGAMESISWFEKAG